MKKSLFLFYFLLTAAVFGQLIGPKISFSEKEFDFGKLNEGDVVTHVFTIFNTGDDLLKIERVRASCGCTAAITEKKELTPNESTTLEVKFNSNHKRGKQKKYVYVTSNDPNNKETRLIFYADVKAKTGITSKKIDGAILSLRRTQYNFGKVKEGKVLPLTVKFKNPGTKTLIIKDVKSSCGCTAAVVSDKKIKPSDDGEIRIEMDTNGYSGRLTRTVSITSNDVLHPIQTITLFVNIIK